MSSLTKNWISFAVWDLWKRLSFNPRIKVLNLAFWYGNSRYASLDDSRIETILVLLFFFLTLYKFLLINYVSAFSSHDPKIIQQDWSFVIQRCLSIYNQNKWKYWKSKMKWNILLNSFRSICSLKSNVFSNIIKMK